MNKYVIINAQHRAVTGYNFQTSEGVLFCTSNLPGIGYTTCNIFSEALVGTSPAIISFYTMEAARDVAMAMNERFTHDQFIAANIKDITNLSDQLLLCDGPVRPNDTNRWYIGQLSKLPDNIVSTMKPGGGAMFVPEEDVDKFLIFECYSDAELASIILNKYYPTTNFYIQMMEEDKPTEDKPTEDKPTMENNMTYVIVRHDENSLVNESVMHIYSFNSPNTETGSYATFFPSSAGYDHVVKFSSRDTADAVIKMIQLLYPHNKYEVKQLETFIIVNSKNGMLTDIKFNLADPKSYIEWSDVMDDTVFVTDSMVEAQKVLNVLDVMSDDLAPFAIQSKG